MSTSEESIHAVDEHYEADPDGVSAASGNLKQAVKSAEHDVTETRELLEGLRPLDEKELTKKPVILSEMVASTSVGDLQLRPTILQSLAAFYHKRFQSLGDLEDIEMAIQCQSKAVSVCSNQGSIKSVAISGLGCMHLSRFQRLGNLMDLQVAIEHSANAVHLAEDDEIQRAGMLNNLGNSHHERYKHFGEMADLEMAVSCQSQAVSLTPDSHPDQPSLLANLGGWYYSQFEGFGRLVDLDMAISCEAQTVDLTPEGHADKPTMLSNLGVSYARRFKHLGQPADLEAAVSHKYQGVSLTLDGHPDKPGWLANLGCSYFDRFDRFGQLVDLDMAISCEAQAAELTPEGHSEKPWILGNLGASYERRFKHLGQPADLETAVSYQSQAVSLTPDGHRDKPLRLANLGGSYCSRFERFGQLADIDMAISCEAQAVDLSPEGHPDKPRRLSRLGGSYQRRFNHLGQPSDLERAVSHQSQAVSLTPDGHPNKPLRLNNLGGSYSSRFERFGLLADLDMAISSRAQAFNLSPEGHPENSMIIDNLGTAYELRFKYLGQPADLEIAVSYVSQAVSLTPDGDPAKPMRLSNLGGSYQSRFDQFGRLVDIDMAISFQTQAVDLTPEGHPDKPTILNNLGASYERRFKYLGQPADLETAISYASQAVSLIPDGHPDKPSRMANLGGSYAKRFLRFGQLVDLELAISCHSEALLLTPDEHPLRFRLLFNLASIHQSRFKTSSDTADVHASIALFKHAALSKADSPARRLQASRKWASLSFYHDAPSSLEAYQQTMTLIPQIAWMGSSVSHRYLSMSSIKDVVIEASSAAFVLQRLDLALEWFEEGRSIVWKQLTHLRTPLQSLRAANPVLADRFQEVSKGLDATALPNATLEVATQGRHRLAEEWEQLIHEVRLLPGMSHFLRSKSISDLVGAAQGGPVVVLNVHRAFCSGLVLHPDPHQISVVPLPEFSEKKVTEAYNQFARCLRLWPQSSRGFKVGNHKEKDTLMNVLAMLWKAVAKPFLDHLGYTRLLSVEDLPRITWCTTGSLSFLPLHAAGDYTRPHCALHDYAVSSYTPSLGALIDTPISAVFKGILGVGQSSTHGFSPLKHTVSELEGVKEKASGLLFTVLQGDVATPTAVLDAMEQHSWVHFACHGSQDQDDPMKSAFHLHDGPLDLATITRRPLKHAQLAYLSACQTATGYQELPDEAVHLAAGMMMAGYPTVIATMWSIKDEDGPVVASKFYEYVLKDGVPDASRAARGLHSAVGYLRSKLLAEKGEADFTRWAAFIHMGR